jgi:DNA repair protein RadC
MRRTTAARLESRPLLTTSNDLRDYLRIHLAYERVENVRVLYLDAARRLIADELVGRGNTSEAPMYIGTILGRALELGAGGILVAHNHPSGRMEPSEADRLITEQLAVSAEIVGITLLDHLIVTRTGCISVKNEPSSRKGIRQGTILASATVADLDLVTPGLRQPRPPSGFMQEQVQPAPGDLTREKRLAVVIRCLIRERTERGRLFPQVFFGDPCWNIMLDVFVCELEGSTTSVKSACLAARVPVSTALRWVEALCRKDVLQRSRDPVDGRRSFLRLSAESKERMIAYAEMVRQP